MRKKLILILLVLILTLYISKNYYQLNLIQGTSMYPTYKNMQFTLIDRRAADFQCGDVIVFYCPSQNSTMVKRIIAGPGDAIQITNGIVQVNGDPSPYVCEPVSYGGIARDTLTISADHFFVMGDNPAQSRDSRYEEIGCIDRSHIVGRLIPNRPPQCEKQSLVN